MKKCPLLSSTYRRGEKKFPALCNESPDYGVRGQRADVRLHPLSFCLIVIPRTGTRSITAAQLSSEITVLCLGSPPPCTSTPPLLLRLFLSTVALYLFPHHVSRKRDRALNERNFRFPCSPSCDEKSAPTVQSGFYGGENVFSQVVANEVRSAFLCQKSDRFDK